MVTESKLSSATSEATEGLSALKDLESFGFDAQSWSREIVISESGELQFLEHEQISSALASQGSHQMRRASHVEPSSLALRWAFHLLRAAFGEKGRVAAWTRAWKVLWRIDLRPSGGPIFGFWRDREVAIRYEEKWLLENRLR